MSPAGGMLAPIAGKRKANTVTRNTRPMMYHDGVKNSNALSAEVAIRPLTPLLCVRGSDVLCLFPTSHPGIGTSD
jgi:hypothetical protein